MSKLLLIKSQGIEFNVRILNEGDKYGLNNCLTHESKKPLVEFYDNRFPHTEFGQFISRYYIDTILNMKNNEGLDLQGGVPDWKINATEMNSVVAWLKVEKNKNEIKMKI